MHIDYQQVYLRNDSRYYSVIRHNLYNNSNKVYYYRHMFDNSNHIFSIRHLQSNSQDHKRRNCLIIKYCMVHNLNIHILIIQSKSSIVYYKLQNKIDLNKKQLVQQTHSLVISVLSLEQLKQISYSLHVQQFV
ncbi:unnamed protein product [Paramecium octaurelia]|uniref:Uncharacterized protein n=1 Tax=Paramecium octaurelia TaxID=43137 RepID=A0A8S1SX58_PAROT|nr:unnamed protein product [Paramecium octaurelia]